MTNEPVTVNDWRLAVIRDHLAALPDGHGGKITREMVDDVETVLSGCRNFAPSDNDDARLYRSVESLIAALRSILPARPAGGGTGGAEG